MLSGAGSTEPGWQSAPAPEAASAAPTPGPGPANPAPSAPSRASSAYANANAAYGGAAYRAASPTPQAPAPQTSAPREDEYDDYTSPSAEPGNYEADTPHDDSSVTAALVGRTVADVERDLIIDTLKHCFGNRTHAANILGISIRTLRNKLRQYTDEGLIVPQPGNVQD